MNAAQQSLFPAPPKQRKPRPPDPIWDEMARLFGFVEPGSVEHGKRNKACGDLRKYRATPDEIEYAKRVFHRWWPDANCTDIALASHFGQIRHQVLNKVKSKPCAECGVGGGYHLADCPAVT